MSAAIAPSLHPPPWPQEREGHILNTTPSPETRRRQRGQLF